MPELPAGWSLRRMTEEDLPAVMDVQRGAFKHPWSPDLVKRELSHDWSTILLLEEDRAKAPGGRELLGLSIFWIVHDELHVLNVATAIPHRRRGVARALMAATLATARSRGCSLATLEVRKSNEGALALYKELGFRPVGVRPNYYVDEGEDAVVMVLDF